MEGVCGWVMPEKTILQIQLLKEPKYWQKAMVNKQLHGELQSHSSDVSWKKSWH